MYLDTHERDEIQELIVSFHVRWLCYDTKNIGNMQGIRSFVLLFLYLSSMAMVVWVLPHNESGWTIVVLLGAFIVLSELSMIWHQKKVKERIYANSLERWFQEFQEIEQLDVDGEERQLLLQLFSALRSGSKEEIEMLLAEALQSSKLSHLAFLRELRLHLQ